MRKERNAGDDGRFAFDGFVVEGEVVDDAPDHHAVDDGGEVAGGRGTVFEDYETDKGFGRNEFLIDEEGEETADAEEKGVERAPGVPGVEDPALDVR